MSSAAKALSHRSLRPRHVAGIALVLLVTLWSALWFAATIQFNRALSRWIEAANANGTEISYDRRNTNGTPLSVHTHLHHLNVKTKNGSSLHAGEAVFYLNIWNWGEVSAKLRGGIDGVLASVPFTAYGLKLGFTVPQGEPFSHTETGLALWVHPYVMTFKPAHAIPFGNTLEEGMAELRIMGPVPDFGSKASLKEWNEKGGVVEIDRLYLHWNQMVVTGNGTLALDPAMQPEGAFSARVEGIEPTLEDLVTNGAIDKRQETLLGASLHVLSRPSGLTGASAPVVPITLQNRGLYLGPVKLVTLPEIAW